GRRRFRTGRTLLWVLAAAVGGLRLLRLLSGFLVEVLWFDSVGHADTFWTRTLWEITARLSVTGVAALAALINLRGVAATLGAIRIRRRFGDLEISEQVPRRTVLLGLTVIAVLFGLWFGAALPGGTGIDALVAIRAPAWGQTDPFFERDLGFYVFALPLLRGAVALALALVFLLVALCVAGYAATGALTLERGRLRVSRDATRHLLLLVATFVGLLAVRFALQRYHLLVEGSSDVEGIFGYTDAVARLPALSGLTGVALLAALAIGWAAFRDRVAVAVGAVGSLAAGWLILAQAYPALIQQFRVQPNELAAETPYIEANLRLTREAWGLGGIQRERYTPGPPSSETWAQALPQLDGLPVWSRSALGNTFQRREARFGYYDFSVVGIDRYPGPDGIVPTALSVREIDATRIPDPNWQNLHLRERFVRGMGAVMAVVAGSPVDYSPRLLLSGIPPRAAPTAPAHVRLDRSAVFFGARTQPYAIVTPSDSVFLAPDSTVGVEGVDFPRGIRLDSWLRTLLLAWRFRDANLLFAAEVGDSSRFVFRRSVSERLEAVAPFLRFPSAPYPVLLDGRIVWVLEGYTQSRDFPLSAAYSFEERRAIRYLRNSVKATVDAISGEVHLYVVDPDDPILGAYRRVFPSLFTDLESMPAQLEEHLRYPRELLALQAQVLFRYHQETAAQFHAQQDVWAPAQQTTEGSVPQPYFPEYAWYRLPGEPDPEFLLTTVMVPVNRQNLAALLVGRSDPGVYGQLKLIELPVGTEFPGPEIVEARVEQDPVISQQFSLWRQGGSQVWLGHLHVVPVAGSLLYVEPIYLAAEAGAIPELRRFVVSDGQRAVMEPTLPEAVAALSGQRGGGSPNEQAEDPEGARSTLPLRALELLDQAERALRNGDFAGYGAQMERLRELLERSRGGAS
ncbi:MAG: UPF0182 family protein, partial [Gemmatimonadetes bacterium]|nr:UPF0182 family protein [Gemmatimonadota bacterium]